MMKTLISALIFFLVKRVSTIPSETIDVQIIDAGFFFHLFQVSRRHQLKTAKEIPGKHQAALLSTLEQLVANRPIYHSVFELWEATILRLLF